MYFSQLVLGQYPSAMLFNSVQYQKAQQWLCIKIIQTFTLGCPKTILKIAVPLSN